MKTWVVLVSLEVEADDEDGAVREANRQVPDGIVESVEHAPTFQDMIDFLTPEVSE